MKNATIKDLHNVITQNPVDAHYATDLSEIRKNPLPVTTYQILNKETGQRHDFLTLPVTVEYYSKLSGNVGDWLISHSNGTPLTTDEQSFALSYMQSIVRYNRR
jgi:hypothetical protein